ACECGCREDGRRNRKNQRGSPTAHLSKSGVLWRFVSEMFDSGAAHRSQGSAVRLNGRPSCPTGEKRWWTFRNQRASHKESSTAQHGEVSLLLRVGLHGGAWDGRR